MQWKYCPFCANLGVKREGNEWFCSKCDWKGIPDEGDMQIINQKAKAYIPGNKWHAPLQEYEDEDENDEGNEKLKTKQVNYNDENDVAEKGFVAQIRPSNASGKNPKSAELNARLKGKMFGGDAEFL